MKLINSYIFLSKDKKRNQDNKLIIKSSITKKKKKFFNADVDSYLLGEIEDNPEKLSKEILDKYNKTTRGKFFHIIDDKKIDVYYKFIKAGDIFYLDITIDDIKSNIIKCFENFNDCFLTKKEFTSDYITIISYDCVSEYYCNKIYPFLNTFERSDFVALSDTFKAISDPVRREILEMLKNEKKSAGEIAEKFNLTNATVSYHLSQLKKADLITETREKNYIFYELNVSVFEDVLVWIYKLGGNKNEKGL